MKSRKCGGNCGVCLACNRERIRKETGVRPTPTKSRVDPNYARNYHLLNNYGITLEDYQRMFAEQGGRCLICNREKRLVVDHCHDNGHVRGLLCDRCNTGLGQFEDNADLLQKAVDYLKSGDIFDPS